MKKIKNTIIFSIIHLCIHIIGYAQFEEFTSQYDLLSTIAGKGDEEQGGVNGWKEEYEGGRAIDAELSRPHFAMADSAGNIYIADKDAHAIRKVTTNGIITTVAGTNTAGYNGDDGLGIELQLNSPNGIWVKSDGTVFILDLGNNKIRRLDTDGYLNTILQDTSGIDIGRGLWVSQDEKLIYYASNSEIKKWTETDGLTTYASGFVSLGNIFVDPDGFLVVTDRGANSVYRINDDGAKEIVAGNGTLVGGSSGSKATEKGLAGVRGIWIMEDESYLLATHEGSQIWYVDTSGIINLLLNGLQGDDFYNGDGEHFQTPGYKISEVRSVSMDYKGNIIIVENDRGFIRKISKKEESLKIQYNELSYQISNFEVYPNPFNHTVKIKYYLSTGCEVKIDIYDLFGKVINTLINSYQSPGEYEIYWDATNNLKLSINPGIYIYKIKAGNFYETGKIFYSGL